MADGPSSNGNNGSNANNGKDSTRDSQRDSSRENGRSEPAKQQADYNVRTFDRDDLDIPAFLRRQQRTTNGH